MLFSLILNNFAADGKAKKKRHKPQEDRGESWPGIPKGREKERAERFQELEAADNVD